jgi:DNA-directed RNA polymerase specialized sigma24 family protein
MCLRRSAGIGQPYPRRRGARERRALRRLSRRELLDEDGVARMNARIDAAAHARVVHAALQRLPERRRVVLELTAVDGLSVAEAARAAGMRAVAARVALERRLLCELQLLVAEQPATTPGARDAWLSRLPPRLPPPSA